MKGIGFDATCSLVLIDKNGHPLTVSKTSVDEQNVILWMDHRAAEEADQINATAHPILKYVGGKVSLEMQMPKLLWLKRYLPYSFNNLGRAFDLPDYLTWRATGVDTRSLCSVVCKWNYDAEENKWNADFLRSIDLEELTHSNFSIIGNHMESPGKPVGSGLTKLAAEELGLLPGTMVSTSLIDAHAGILGTLGCQAEDIDEDITTRMALIAGTSTCHMSLTKSICFAKGIWGPYKSAVLPGYYLNEGGQSIAGHLLDHILKSHDSYATLKDKLGGDKSVNII